MLFIWGSPGGEGYAFPKWSTTTPSERVDFELLRDYDDGIDLYLELGLEIGEWLDVRLARFPYRRLKLDWPRYWGGE